MLSLPQVLLYAAGLSNLYGKVTNAQDHHGIKFMLHYYYSIETAAQAHIRTYHQVRSVMRVFCFNVLMYIKILWLITLITGNFIYYPSHLLFCAWVGLWITSLIFIALKSNPTILRDLDIDMEYVRTLKPLAAVLEYHVKLITLIWPLGTLVCHRVWLQNVLTLSSPVMACDIILLILSFICYSFWACKGLTLSSPPKL
jgi:hypothetical protein